MSSVLFRIHEWLADHVSWIQYPRVRRVGQKAPFFKHQMPWYVRIGLLVFGGITAVVGSLVLILMAYLVFGLVFD